MASANSLALADKTVFINRTIDISTIAPLGEIVSYVKCMCWTLLFINQQQRKLFASMFETNKIDKT